MDRKFVKTIILLIIVFVAGILFLIYPYINRVVTDKGISKNVKEFAAKTDTVLEKPVNSNTHDDISAEQLYSQLWEDIQAYNEEIYTQGQSGLHSEHDYEIPSFTLADYGLESEIFAVLSVPALDLELPVYLGATDKNLKAGAAHMSQTSLPVGGENTNCVIAGHRGYNGAPYLRYIEKLSVGDVVTVKNLWETLTYEVVDILIVAPDDIEVIHIQKGRDLLTILTCHPYAGGGRQRYLVICERTGN